MPLFRRSHFAILYSQFGVRGFLAPTIHRLARLAQVY